MKAFKKICGSLLFVFCIVGALTSCSTHTCDYCGGDAVWKAQEYVLGMEPTGDVYYVCADCKRDGKGPIAFSGNQIKWTHL